MPEPLSPGQLRLDPALAPLLVLATESVPFLEAAFGASSQGIQARILRDEAGAPMVRVVVLVAADDATDLDSLLRRFDQTWWLANCHRGEGRLVFDYETLPVHKEDDDA